MKYLIISILISANLFSYSPMNGLEVSSDSYERKRFTGPSSWVDADKDCQDTRVEVLIEENIGILEFKSKKNCKIKSGLWYDFYSDSIFIDPLKLDIEHVVALKDAWVSGAKNWNSEKRKEFANYLNNKDHLMAVYLGENRSKGSRGPDLWLPSNEDFRKEYCRRYIRIKLEWNLTVTHSQLKALQNVLGDEEIIYPKVR